MNIAAPFIQRPVATTLMTVAIVLAGILGFNLLPVAPLPQVDFPTISVTANLPGASPETIAATVATPLERQLGRIAGVSELTSTSSSGSARITLQFDLDRNIDGAARDVQAAINAARGDLPIMPANPTYRKLNPADAPMMVIAMTSPTLAAAQVYDVASTIVAQRLSQVSGVGQVSLGGSSLPAVRVELNPQALAHYGVGLNQVATTLAAANPHKPLGSVEDNHDRWQLHSSDQMMRAEQYQPLVLAYRNGAPIHLSDVADIVDSVEDVRNAGSADGKPAVLLILFRQPGANIIETIDHIKEALPELRASLPQNIDMRVMLDRSPIIRASLRDVERTLAISVVLVILVVWFFLRNIRATLIPSIVLPVSLAGTFGVMYLCHYTLDTISLMALTIATGFVVDDAIVVLENVSRHIENGMPPIKASLLGAREVSFTVLSISLSLIAVFIPILLMGGIIGRLFREFSVTLSIAVLISLLLSLTTTPTLCARVLRNEKQNPGKFYTWSEHFFDTLLDGYRRSLEWALQHRRTVMVMLLATILLNIYLYTIVPKGFFPQQDTGRLIGAVQADQGISFQAMRQKMADFIRIVQSDPAVDTVVAFNNGSQRNMGTMFVGLKPLAERNVSADDIIARLRSKLATEAGATLSLQATQDIRMGGRPSASQYQYTLEGENLTELRDWSIRLLKELKEEKILADVNTDQQDKGLDVMLTVDRETAARLGITIKTVDTTLNEAFGQQQVSTLYDTMNQYHVVMEVAPGFRQSPDVLKDLTVLNNNGVQVPLYSFSQLKVSTSPLSVNHQGQFAATTLSFNLPPGVSLDQGVAAINQAMKTISMPESIHGGFQGIAKVFRSSLNNQPFLILAALAAVYIVLGILYESYIHPLTILSTLPSAGVGAILALLLTHTEFNIMTMIGVLLLIGIVKKNAILMIDFALVTQRQEQCSSHDAIYRACLLRFRPIMMTTMSALLGAIPLAIGFGEGSEMRRPLGIAIVGGLVVSQMLTLYTMPVVYLYLERLSLWCKSLLKASTPAYKIMVAEND
jgi:multidrug efflux pump